jgi:hypothetical protein
MDMTFDKLEDEGMGPGCAVFVCVQLNSKNGNHGNTNVIANFLITAMLFF